MQIEIIAGLLKRKEFRRYLKRENYQFKEDKGILDSQFLIQATPEQVARLKQIVQLNS